MDEHSPGAHSGGSFPYAVCNARRYVIFIRRISRNIAFSREYLSCSLSLLLSLLSFTVTDLPAASWRVEKFVDIRGKVTKSRDENARNSVGGRESGVNDKRDPSNLSFLMILPAVVLFTVTNEARKR